jgi:hypothetical protein
VSNFYLRSANFQELHPVAHILGGSGGDQPQQAAELFADGVVLRCQDYPGMVLVLFHPLAVNPIEIAAVAGVEDPL